MVTSESASSDLSASQPRWAGGGRAASSSTREMLLQGASGAKRDVEGKGVQHMRCARPGLSPLRPCPLCVRPPPLSLGDSDGSHGGPSLAHVAETASGEVPPCPDPFGRKPHGALPRS